MLPLSLESTFSQSRDSKSNAYFLSLRAVLAPRGNPFSKSGF
ncbi:hypothetical protein [Helicobacter zhangjianzhongii]|uniref:Uncharacterized protein n=1 Tax=Helicobacter zhangjianzhongii TaxID=2974574 RepID=A0ACC6FTY4_9HELI|nr:MULTISPECIES: hypothetical protein [unclassified Helicobacter]MDL0080598.1 hypothetical protein [Helicobacter sp. CPD2-1]MDL0082761.1 hypothetical protein [Helicobacter sp. XJK30-2]